MKLLGTFSKILLSAVVLITVTSCDLFEQRSRAFDDDPVVEFFPLNQQVTEDDDDTPSTIELTLEVQLIGPQRSEALSVAFSVDAGNTDAVDGVHYELVTSSPVTIPANSSQAEITINVLPSPLDDDEFRQLALTLEGSDEVPASENLKNYTLTINGQTPPP